jgi:hypothetical protein
MGWEMKIDSIDSHTISNVQLIIDKVDIQST